MAAAVAADHQVEENIFIKEQQTHCQTIFPFFGSCCNINRFLIELLFYFSNFKKILYLIRGLVGELSTLLLTAEPTQPEESSLNQCFIVKKLLNSLGSQPVTQCLAF